VRKHHALLHAALEHAVQWGLLAANVCDRVKPPKKRRKEPQRWDSEQVKLFLGEAKRSSRFYRLYLAMRVTGARPGELLGLRWPDVDLTTGAITIRQKFYRLGGSKREGEPTRLLFSEPKTDKGRRTIDIPPILVEELRTLKAEQDALRKEFGPQYHDLGEHGPLVFCQPDGRPLNWEHIVRRDFRRIIELHRSLDRCGGRGAGDQIRTGDLRITSAPSPNPSRPIESPGSQNARMPETPETEGNQQDP
jgi:integrase